MTRCTRWSSSSTTPPSPPRPARPPDRMGIRGRPVVLTVGLPDLPRPVTGHAPTQRRVDLLAIEQNAWTLAARDRAAWSSPLAPRSTTPCATAALWSGRRRNSCSMPRCPCHPRPRRAGAVAGRTALGPCDARSRERNASGRKPRARDPRLTPAPCHPSGFPRKPDDTARQTPVTAVNPIPCTTSDRSASPAPPARRRPALGRWPALVRPRGILDRGQRPRILPVAEVPGDILDRLTAPRPAFAGVTLDRPRLMGVLNVTPDSFSDGGRSLTPAWHRRRRVRWSRRAPTS